jgi:hypothetical protein
MVARKVEAKIRDQLASGGASANLRLPGAAYIPGNGLFDEAAGVGGVERPGRFRFQLARLNVLM